MTKKTDETKESEEEFAGFILKLYNAYKEKYGDPEEPPKKASSAAR